MEIPDHLICLLRNLYAGQEATARPRLQTMTGSKLGKEYHKAVYYHPIYLTLFIYLRVHQAKCQAGWVTRGNQDCWQKYQQSQTCGWYHFNGRKGRGTKEPLDEGERGEWKNWIKTQHSKNKVLKIQYFGHLMRREKTLMLRKIEAKGGGCGRG